MEERDVEAVSDSVVPTYLEIHGKRKRRFKIFHGVPDDVSQEMVAFFKNSTTVDIELRDVPENFLPHEMEYVELD